MDITTPIFHSSDYKIAAPDPLIAAKYCPKFDGHPIVALFSNTCFHLSVYGKNLYRFTLAPDAKVLEMDLQMYEQVRLSHAYRAGLFTAARACGIQAFRRSHSGSDTSVVVLDFEIIENWTLV